MEDGSFIKKDIYINGERFTENESGDEAVIDAEGLYAIPGLTDIHFHGCVGYDFCDGTHEATEAIAVYEAANGITSMAPATITLGDEELTRIFSNAGTYENRNGASLVGINMEGPYLSYAKKGSQNPAFLRVSDL